jgi:hypothetical protein
MVVRTSFHHAMEDDDIRAKMINCATKFKPGSFTPVNKDFQIQVSNLLARAALADV